MEPPPGLPVCQSRGRDRFVETSGHRHCCRRCRNFAGARHGHRCDAFAAATLHPPTHSVGARLHALVPPGDPPNTRSRSRSRSIPTAATPGATLGGHARSAIHEATDRQTSDGAADATQCPMCWEPFRPSDSLAAHECGHVVHAHCVRTVGAQCAVCRRVGVPFRIFFS